MWSAPLLLLCACACIVQAVQHVTLYEQGDGSHTNIGYKWYYIFPQDCNFIVNIPDSLCYGSGLGSNVRAVKAEVTDEALATIDVSNDLKQVVVKRVNCNSRAVLYLWAHCSNTPVHDTKEE